MADTNIEFRHAPYKRRRIKIEAFRGENELGSFDYLPSLIPNRPVVMGLLSVQDQYQRQGVGSALLREFGREVGSNTKVTAAVVHEDTLEYLERFNYNLEAAHRFVLNLSDQSLVREVPIAKVLNSGGIEVVRFRIIYNSKDVRLRAGNNIHGLTLNGRIRQIYL